MHDKILSPTGHLRSYATVCMQEELSKAGIRLWHWHCLNSSLTYLCDGSTVNYYTSYNQSRSKCVGMFWYLKTVFLKWLDDTVLLNSAQWNFSTKYLYADCCNWQKCHDDILNLAKIAHNLRNSTWLNFVANIMPSCDTAVCKRKQTACNISILILRKWIDYNKNQFVR